MISTQNTFTHMTVYPSQSSCHGRGCYCFYAKSPLDYEDDISEISSISSWNHDDDRDDTLDDFTDLPPVVQRVIAPFLEPDDTDDQVPPNKHLYFDEDGNEISETDYLAKQPIGVEYEADYEDDEDPDEEWGFKLNKIIFRHPRVLLSYFRFVDLQNEVAGDGEELKIPLIPKDIADKMLEHSSIRNPPDEFVTEVADLILYIARYTKTD